MTISINLDKAREIHRNNIRAARALKFIELDVAFMQTVESGNTKKRAEITKQKQALRDATKDPLIEEATLVEEIKAAWNEELLGPSPYSN